MSGERGEPRASEITPGAADNPTGTSGLAALPRRALAQLAAWRFWPTWRELPAAPSEELAARLERALAPAERERLLAVHLRPGRPYHRELLTALLGPPSLEYALTVSDEATLARAALDLGLARTVEGTAVARRRALAASLRALPRSRVLPALGFSPDPTLPDRQLADLAAAREAQAQSRDAAAAAMAAELCHQIRTRAGQRLSTAGVAAADKGKIAQAFERRITAWTGQDAARGAGPDFELVEFKAVPLLRGRNGTRPADAKIKLCGVTVEPREKLRHVVWGYFWKDDDSIAGAAATFWPDAEIEELLSGDGIVEAPAGASGAGQRALYLRSRILRDRGLLP